MITFHLILLFFIFKCEFCADRNMYNKHLGTKTPYRIVANLNDSLINFQGCEALKIWMLVRHGTRNPSQDVIEYMKTNLTEIRNMILNSSNDIDSVAFKQWSFNLDDHQEKLLTIEGEREMVALAERMQSRLTELFPPVYSPTWYKFKYTATQRTKASANFFATGLFGSPTAKDVIYPEPLHRDPILRFYKLCDRWREEVSKNYSAYAELHHFQNSLIMKNVVSELNKRLQLQRNLTQDEVRLMYTACAFETAWNEKSMSPWCEILDLDMLKVIEFWEDLKYYYRDGYGHKLTYDQGCQAFKDMIDTFDRNDPYPKATVYFTHSGTLLKMLAHVGLYQDNPPLLHTSFEAERLWRVSKIDAFGTNLAFVLYRCGKQNKIVVLHQERVMTLPNLETLADMDEVKRKFASSLACPFKDMCKLSNVG